MCFVVRLTCCSGTLCDDVDDGSKDRTSPRHDESDRDSRIEMSPANRTANLNSDEDSDAETETGDKVEKMTEDC